MWKCTNCGEIHEDQFDVCWNCCAERSPNAAEVFESPEPETKDIGVCVLDDVDIENILDNSRFWEGMGFGYFKRKNLAKYLASVQRALSKESILLRAIMEEVSHSELFKFEPGVTGHDYENYIDKANPIVIESEIYNRLMSISYLRADILLLRRRQEKQRNQTKGVSKDVNKLAFDEGRLRAAHIRSYLFYKTKEAKDAFDNHRLDAGHVRTLAEAAIIGVPEASELLADITEQNKSYDENAARIETYFWLERTINLTKDKRKLRALNDRISSIKRNLTEDDFKKIDEYRLKLDKEISSAISLTREGRTR